MKAPKMLMPLLTAVFAVLMSLPFLFPHQGVWALIGIVPLLIMDDCARIYKVKRFFWWYYGAFVLWNAMTTFWVCNATVGGGIFAVLANAAQMTLIFAVYRLSRRKFSRLLSLVFLSAMWIAWERFYFDAEISWPWLTLGNAFAGSTRCIQWYEYTGTLGGSLWIWTSNIFIYYLVSNTLTFRWREMSRREVVAFAAGLLTVIAAPLAISFHIYDAYAEKSIGTQEVVIGQPNFDPYQKFEALSQSEQNERYLSLLREGIGEESVPYGVLFIAPETFTSDMVLDRIAESGTFHAFGAFMDSYPGSSMLYGASTRRFYPNRRTAPTENARQLRDDLWVQSYNAAFLQSGWEQPQVYLKSKLVVGTEMTPYPRLFSRLDDALGGVMGRCEGQDSISLLTLPSGTALGSIVCYESVYGEFCTGYVREGAQFLAVITNDAWWGDTPGYRQHFNYSRLRAIETRRDIARCANTGISAFIDQKGDVVSSTPWWEPACLEGTVNLSDSETFFVHHGDFVGRACTLMFLLLLLAFITALITNIH